MSHALRRPLLGRFALSSSNWASSRRQRPGARSRPRIRQPHLDGLSYEQRDSACGPRRVLQTGEAHNWRATASKSTGVSRRAHGGVTLPSSSHSAPSAIDHLLQVARKALVGARLAVADDLGGVLSLSASSASPRDPGVCRDHRRTASPQFAQSLARQLLLDLGMRIAAAEPAPRNASTHAASSACRQKPGTTRPEMCSGRSCVSVTSIASLRRCSHGPMSEDTTTRDPSPRVTFRFACGNANVRMPRGAGRRG